MIMAMAEDKLMFSSSLLAGLGKPTKPPSSFFIFCGERRPALRGSYIQNIRQMGQEWGGMGAKEKEVVSRGGMELSFYHFRP